MNGYIYVLRCGEYAKIGFSRNPELRLAAAQNLNPLMVSMVCQFEGTPSDERSLQERFSFYHHRGEWFVFQGAFARWANENPIIERDSDLHDWIKAERGRLTKLADDLKVTPGAISQWRKVPAERVRAVSKATGLAPHVLRPDIFAQAEPAQ